jgi:hydroxymethylglutaryl-CoA reductase
MIENAVGIFGIPVGIACTFTINGRDVLVPMATEEPSVVAAASDGQ